MLFLSARMYIRTPNHFLFYSYLKHIILLFLIITEIDFHLTPITVIINYPKSLLLKNNIYFYT